MTGTATLTPTMDDAATPQHLKALEQANKVRLARAELKRRVAAGELAAAEVVLSRPWEADSMTIADLLMSQRRWGRTRCRKLLLSIPMSENKRLGTMTERQALAVAATLSPGSSGAILTARLSQQMTPGQSGAPTPQPRPGAPAPPARQRLREPLAAIA